MSHFSESKINGYENFSLTSKSIPLIIRMLEPSLGDWNIWKYSLGSTSDVSGCSSSILMPLRPVPPTTPARPREARNWGCAGIGTLSITKYNNQIICQWYNIDTELNIFHQVAGEGQSRYFWHRTRCAHKRESEWVKECVVVCVCGCVLTIISCFIDIYS